MHNNTSFYIQNVENGEYLHQSNSNSILVVSRKTRNENSRWTFLSSNPCDNYFRIKNSATGMYLETFMKDFLDNSTSSGIFSLRNCINKRIQSETTRLFK